MTVCVVNEKNPASVYCVQKKNNNVVYIYFFKCESLCSKLKFFFGFVFLASLKVRTNPNKSKCF